MDDPEEVAEKMVAAIEDFEVLSVTDRGGAASIMKHVRLAALVAYQTIVWQRTDRLKETTAMHFHIMKQ